MKKLPDELVRQQNERKEQTVFRVKAAIDELTSEGCKISMALIAQHSGLSRSVLSKPHIRAVLHQYSVGYGQVDSVPKQPDKKAETLQQLCNSKDGIIQKLRSELARKTTECELLRGKLHILMQNCRIKGIEMSD